MDVKWKSGHAARHPRHKASVSAGCARVAFETTGAPGAAPEELIELGENRGDFI
jgi:hypothetical protein